MPTSHPETSMLANEPIGYERYDSAPMGYERYDEEEYDVFRILELVWRRWWLVAASCAVGVVVAVLVAIAMPNQYTAEVVVQARLQEKDQQLRSEAWLDAATVMQTQLNLISSREFALRVVTSLGLAEVPNAAAPGSFLDRALALLTFWHSSSPSFPDSSVTHSVAVADELLKKLEVINDARSLTIRIRYTSTLPEESARIANAFAQEFRRTRVRGELADLAVTYGPRHPGVLRAQAQLDALGSRSTSDSVGILDLAAPPISPSGPNRRLIVAVSLICSFAAGIVLVLILERTNTSFRSDKELASKAKAPCLGIFVEDLTSSETARAIVMAAGCGTESAQSKTLLITCSVPEEGACLVSTAIARSLVQMGRRALLLDLSREAPKTSKSLTLENVLDGLEHHALQLDEQLTVAQSASEGCGESIVTSRNFSLLVEQARQKCDLLIIAAPPVMIAADALYLGRQADFVLHVVRWNSTPRRAVFAALDRLRNFGIRVNGVLLSRVHKKELRRLTGVAGESRRRTRSVIVEAGVPKRASEIYRAS